jgi:hypothetical protein
VRRLSGLRTAKERGHNGTRLTQLRHRGQDRWVWRGRTAKIGPGGGQAQARPVREHQDKLELTLVGDGAEDLQCVTVEGVAVTSDGHPLWVAVDVVVMGIVSCSPSTESTTTG